ncbi:MAG TPA: DNA polymerase IV, partial [Chroococcidiopsis sp.]
RPEQRGAIAAASYEARKFGIHSAMPSRLAQQKCPHLIFVKPRFEVYREVSDQIHAIFHRYTDWVEPLSLDEAYLDVTENKRQMPSATRIAEEIKQAIATETHLTASAGVSVNKFLAKMASGINKPNGLYLIRPEQAEAFVAQLPIEQFYGIGPATAAKMHQLGIQTGADLRQWSETDLVHQFGKVGQFYYRIARGQDPRPVNPNRVRKSIGVETSFDVDLGDRPALLQALDSLAHTLHSRLGSKQARGRTLTLKVKYADYHQVTRSRTVLLPLQQVEAIAQLARELLNSTEAGSQKVRLLGLTVSNLEDAKEGENAPSDRYIQLTLNF